MTGGGRSHPSSNPVKAKERRMAESDNGQAAPKVSFRYVEDRGRASDAQPGDMNALTAHVSGARFEDIPAEAVARAKLRVLDLFGCGLGGIPGGGNAALVRCLEAAGSAPRASVIGSGVKLSAGDAALANAVIARSYDFEVMTVVVDGVAIGSHNSPTTCMTALAVAEERDLSGRDFLAALIVGDDLAARMLAASGLDLGAGWDASSIFTTIPAAAIAARLMGLDALQTRDAMGHALETTGGTTQSVWDGIPAWKLVGGLAARNGIFAAHLASTGEWPATGDPFNAGYGFFGQFTTGCLNPAILSQELGRAYYGEEYFKPYPSCAATQAPMECVLEMCGNRQFAPDEVVSVIVRLPDFVLGTALALPFEPARDSHTRANFSIRYQIANAILRGAVRQPHYTEDAIASPDIAALIGKLELAPLAPSGRGIEAEMALADGRRLIAAHSGVTWRHPQRSPSTETEVLNKFYDQVSFSGAIPQAGARELANRVLAIEEEPAIGAVAALLGPS
jgi:2-methylcitrate dehydratase